MNEAESIEILNLELSGERAAIDFIDNTALLPTLAGDNVDPEILNVEQLSPYTAEEISAKVRNAIEGVLLKHEIGEPSFPVFMDHVRMRFGVVRIVAEKKAKLISK